jgi:multidrug efflux pump subunit AcrB
MFITQSMSNLGSTALQAVALTFLVLLFFLRNVRSSMIVAVSIPVSIVVTFAVMDQAGLTLNIISMAGLALAVGMLVDNSIVVLESIFRHSQEGKAPREAADVGTTEVAMAITASTLTTLGVFVPVLFVPGLAGELFNEMVVTICFSLALSLLVALTLIPLLASRFRAHRSCDSSRSLPRRPDGRWLDRLHAVCESSTGLYTTVSAPAVHVRSVPSLHHRSGESGGRLHAAERHGLHVEGGRPLSRNEPDSDGEELDSAQRHGNARRPRGRNGVPELRPGRGDNGRLLFAGVQ